MGLLFARVDAWAMALILAAAMLVAWRLGWRSGRTLQARGEDPSLGKLDDASIALLGLLLAFSFSMALGKHDRRREMVVADSNAIGDFYTCASLLPDPVRSELQKVIREYTEHRLELVRRHALLEEKFDQELRRMHEMQGRMTDLVARAVNQGTPVAVPLANTLNGLTSNHAARLAAIEDRLPLTIVATLFFASIVAAALVGRNQGSSPHPRLTGTLTFVILVTLVIYVTLDLNQPYRGLIEVSQAPMERVLGSMTR
jgi:hypothetical protein